MKKRISALLLVLALVACAAIGLAACNEGGKDGGGAGKKIFTESASLDDVISALENAESFTVEYRATSTYINSGEVFSESYSIATVGKTAGYELSTGEFDGEVHKYDAAKFTKGGEVYLVYRFNEIYDEISDDYIITDEMVPERIEKNLVSNSDPVADECISTLSELLTEENGKIVPDPELTTYYTDLYLRLEGDRLVIGFSGIYNNERETIEYVYSKVNATDVVIPEEVKALAYDADWADYVHYNGVSYRKAEDGYGEYYRVYSVQDGAVPEETINTLPVREEGEDPDDPDVELVSYSADSSACRGLLTGTLTFVSEKHWIMYIGGSAADLSTNDNWCRGEYYFEGDEGRSLLHISLYGPEDYYFDDFGADEMYNQNDPAYDPSSARLVGNDGEPVEAYGEEVVIAPDANGSYVIRVTLYGVMEQILNAGGTKEDGWFEFVFDTRGGNKF